MAKRKRASTKIRRVFVKSAPKKRRSTGNSGSGNLTTLIVSSMAYGAIREPASMYLSKLTNNTPFAALGNYGDEVALGLLSYALAKGKIPMLKGKWAKQIGMAGLTIESARLGEGLIGGVLNSRTQTATMTVKTI